MYFQFGLLLMSTIREITSQKALKANKNLCMTHAENTIGRDEFLKEQFLKCDADAPVTEEFKLTVYQKIWKKAIHARAGVEVR